MQNIVEQLVLQEIERLIQAGDVDQTIQTIVGYLMRVTPKEVSDIWQSLLHERGTQKLAAAAATPEFAEQWRGASHVPHPEMAHGNSDRTETIRDNYGSDGSGGW